MTKFMDDIEQLIPATLQQARAEARREALEEAAKIAESHVLTGLWPDADPEIYYASIAAAIRERAKT